MSGNVCILGIDPGASGALAFYFPLHPQMISAEDMPIVDKRVDAATLADRIRQMKPDYAFIESVSARPGQGVSSMFNFGVSFGIAIGVVAACGVPYSLVSSRRWKHHFGLDSDKERSRRMALQQWPARAEVFSRKKDDGRAEAALIALYGSHRLSRDKE